MTVATYDYNTATTISSSWTNFANAVDGSTSTYATREIAKNTSFETGNYITGTANDSSSVSNSSISKVEIGVAAKASSAGNCNLRCIPYFGGSSAGNNHDTAELGTSNSTTYFDVTSDTNAPSTWTWTNVADLDVRMFGDNDNISSAVTVSIAQIYVRVTYEITADLIQEGFRWRNDDGSETAATWKAAQDTDVNIAQEVSQRLRIIVESSSSDVDSYQFRLEYKQSTGSTYSLVSTDTTAAGNDIYIVPSTYIAASGAATTTQLTPPSGLVTGDFIAGRIQDDENPCDAVNLDATSYTELEWCIGSGDTAVDTYDFRLTAYDGTNVILFNSYSVTPQLTIGPGTAITTELHYYKTTTAPNAGIDSDDFSDSTASAAIWTDNDSGGTSTVASGVLTSNSGSSAIQQFSLWNQPTTTGDFDVSVKVDNYTGPAAADLGWVYLDMEYDNFWIGYDGVDLIFGIGGGAPTTVTAPAEPFWIRAKNSGGTGYGYSSTNGTTWTQRKTATIGKTTFQPGLSAYNSWTTDDTTNLPRYTAATDLNDVGASAWVNVANAVDNSLTTFATSDCDGTGDNSNTLMFQTNNNTETSGTITKVEAYVYAKYITAGDNNQLTIAPYYNGSTYGNNTSKNLTTSGAWYSVDVTSQSNAPSTWTWTHINNLDIAMWGNDVDTGLNVAVAKCYLKITIVDVITATEIEWDDFTNSNVTVSETIDMKLYDNDTDMTESMPVYVESDTHYANLEATSYTGQYATDLRVRKGGTTYQVLKQYPGFVDDWTSYLTTTYWSQNTSLPYGTWDSTNQEWDSELYSGFQVVSLEIATYWTEDYRPSKVRVTFTGASGAVLGLIGLDETTEIAGKGTIGSSYTYTSAEELTCSFAGSQDIGFIQLIATSSFSITNIEFEE